MINLILNNFSLFLLLFSIFLLQNPVLTFKIANNFNPSEIEIQAFKNYINKKPINFFNKKIEKLKNKNELLKGIRSDTKKSETIFDRQEFYKKLENYKKLLDWVYKILGFCSLFLVFKFFKRVKF
jgi:cell shape-determining protein MreC